MPSWLVLAAACSLPAALGHPTVAPGHEISRPVAAVVCQDDSTRIGADSLLALRQLLVQHDFTELRRVFRVAERTARRDPAREADLVQLLDAFATGDTLLQLHLTAWVAEHPEDAVARSARARYYAHRALRLWAAQGEAQPTRDDRRASSLCASLAAADLRAARRLDSLSVIPDAVQLELTLADADTRAAAQAMTHALVQLPYSAALRYTYLEILSPRRYGSLAAESTFVATAQRDTFHNPALLGLLGVKDLERGMELSDKGSYARSVSAFTDALAHGEHWRYLQERGYSRLRADQPRDAATDFTRSIALRPGNATSYALRAMAWSALANEASFLDALTLRRRILEDLRTAARLDPTEPQLVSITRGDVASVFSVWRTILP